MNYARGILSTLAAIFIAELSFVWPFLKGSRAVGLDGLAAMFVESLFSPRFWIIGILLFALFFTASRSGKILRVLFFWIPTLVVSTVGVAFLGLCTYLFIRFRPQ